MSSAPPPMPFRRLLSLGLRPSPRRACLPLALGLPIRYSSRYSRLVIEDFDMFSKTKSKRRSHPDV